MSGLASVHRSEIIGATFVLLSAAVYAIQPALVKFTTRTYPPIFFAAVALFFGFAFTAMVFLLKKRPLASLLPEQGNHVFNGVVGNGIAPLLLFIGMQTTAGIDAGILLQMETVYALVLGYFFLHEKISIRQAAFTALVFAGGVIALHKGSVPALTGGVAMILAVPLLYVISNIKAKTLLKRHAIEVVTVMSLFYGTLFLLAASLLFEGPQFALLLDGNFVLYVAINGVLTYGILLYLWYSAITLVNLSKATAIVTLNIIISIISAYLILGEVPTAQQYAGAGLIFAGSLLLTLKVKSEQRKPARHQ